MIYTLPDYEDFLSNPCEDLDPTDPETRELAMRMIEVSKGIGIGLAANQIGERKNLFVAQFDMLEEEPGNPDFFTICVQPQLMYLSTERSFSTEGCLSIPEKTYAVPRNMDVMIMYMDLEGKHCSRRLKGLAAVVAQHETDHIHGITIKRAGKSIKPAPESDEKETT